MPAKKYILYKHTSPSGKVYIGITCKAPEARWGSDGNGYKNQPYFWNAINKYGWENIKHEVLLCDLSKEEACEKEKEYIAKYRSNEPSYGYNMTSGGDVGFKHSPDVVAVISASAKRQWANMSPEEYAERLRAKKERESKRTEKERREIVAKAQATISERYTPEERAEQYKMAADKGRKTKIAKYGGCSKSPENMAAISARMTEYWKEYHASHPKPKKKYRAPKVTVKLSREERLLTVSEKIKQKWQDPEYRAKVTKSCGSKGSHWKLSEEVKAKMRKPKSEETKAKMRKPKSEETRRKMSEAKRKYFDSMTPEQRKQMFGTRNNKKESA